MGGKKPLFSNSVQVSYSLIYLGPLKPRCLKMSGHQKRCCEIHCPHSWEKEKFPKSLSDTWIFFQLPDTCKPRVSLVWSSLIQSHADSLCSGGQDHPRTTSTCQCRLAGEGLWCNVGDRLKGNTNRDLKCQSAKRQAIPHFIAGWELIEVSRTCIKHADTHMSWHGQSRTQRSRCSYNTLLLNVRLVI